MRRTSFDVICDILQIADKEKGVCKTKIVYDANLNFRKAEEYLRVLIDQGFVKPSGNNGNRFETTEKGREFTSRYRDLMTFMGQIEL